MSIRRALAPTVRRRLGSVVPTQPKVTAMRLVLSTDQQLARCLDAESLLQAATALRDEGYVILEKAVDATCLDVLRERMTADTHELLAAHAKGEQVSGWMRGHLQQKPPHHRPFLFADIVANPFAVQVTHAVLGDGLFNAFYSGNTNCPGSEQQPLHRDSRQLWPTWDTAHPATTLVVNISPMDCDADRGSTEIWPGSHLVTGELTDELIEARRAEVPPIRVEAPKGSVMIRDIRLWHRGMPNSSDQIRHMIAMVHQIQWFRRVPVLRFQRGAEDAFESDLLDAHAEVVDAEPEYLFGPHPNHS